MGKTEFVMVKEEDGTWSCIKLTMKDYNRLTFPDSSATPTTHKDEPGIIDEITPEEEAEELKKEAQMEAAKSDKLDRVLRRNNDTTH